MNPPQIDFASYEYTASEYNFNASGFGLAGFVKRRYPRRKDETKAEHQLRLDIAKVAIRWWMMQWQTK